MILLREIDPKFETPAANNLIMQSVPAMLFGFPMLLLAGYANTDMKASIITLCACIGLFALMNFVALFKWKPRKRKGGGENAPPETEADTSVPPQDENEQ